MDAFADFLEENKKDAPQRPLLFKRSDAKDKEGLAALISEGAIRRVSDDYEEQHRELFAIQNPTLVYTPGFEKTFQEHYASLGDSSLEGLWVYFPWSSTLTHVLPEKEFRIVRTARNRNLITEAEQQRFYEARIGIAGLSVGSSVAFAIALGGGGKRMRLADMDTLALSNTNRVLTSVAELGARKVDMAARRIYEINPFADIETVPEGLSKENIEKFFDGLDIVVDEIDNLAVKYLIREQARKHRLAVVMAADNGDNAVVDVERYDLDEHTPFFQGRLGDITYQELAGLDKFGIGKTITKHIGPENVTVRMQESLLEMGKTIVSWPQLGGAALINGAAVAYCVRRILNEQPIENNRALVSLDEKLIPDYFSAGEIAKRDAAAKSFRAIFGL